MLKTFREARWQQPAAGAPHEHTPKGAHVHLLEPTHNDRFMALMDLHLPQWRQVRKRLNSLPVRHEAWDC